MSPWEWGEGGADAMEQRRRHLLLPSQPGEARWPSREAEPADLERALEPLQLATAPFTLPAVASVFFGVGIYQAQVGLGQIRHAV